MVDPSIQRTSSIVSMPPSASADAMYHGPVTVRVRVVSYVPSRVSKFKAQQYDKNQSIVV